jgi:transcriptional regulator with XRE-family HTH domain
MEMDNEIAVGARLKHARLNLKLNLRQLADKVGCIESALAKVENKRPANPY